MSNFAQRGFASGLGPTWMGATSPETLGVKT